jgi:hypothetical protein
MAQRWGDVLDDSDEESDNAPVVDTQKADGGGLEIPPTHKSWIDSKAFRITSFKMSHGPPLD